MINFANLGENYKFTLRSLPRGKQELHPITNSCTVPYNTVTIDDNLNCFLCSCDGWLPLPVGQVFDFESLQDIFASENAKTLQDDIDKKKYTWCAVQHCGIKQSNIDNKHYQIIINIDRSCNLQCPSCRKDKFMITTGSEYDKKLQAAEKILTWLEKLNDKVSITMSGDGDPLASPIMRPIVKNWKSKSTQQVMLKTNGMLLRKQLADSEILHNAKLAISIDAGSKSVFETVRLGGNWKILLDNFDFLVERNKQSSTTLYFALQNNNYLDVENFMSVCDKYKFNGIIHGLDDWGTWANKTVVNPDKWTQQHGYFFDHDVINPAHTNYNACLKILRAINHPRVKLDQVLSKKI